MRIKERLTKNRFLLDIIILSGGTGLAQGILIIVSPLLTRIYTPDDFGILSVYICLFSILVVITALRYQLAIPLPDNDEVAINVLVLSLLIVIGTSALCAFGVLLYGKQIAVWVNSQELCKYLWLLPMSLFGAGVYQVLSYWAIRKKLFVLTARTRVSQSVIMVLIQVGLGFLKGGPVGLLLGDAVGRIAGSGTLAIQAWHKDKIIMKKAISAKKIKDAAKRYKRFPLFSSGSAFLNSAGLQLPTVLLAAFYGPKVAGWFMLSQKIIGTPMLLVGQSVAQVYIGEAARLANNDYNAFKSLFFDTGKRLFLFGFGPIIVLAIGGPHVFAVIFGDVWIQTGKYVRILAFMFLIQFMVVPLSQTLNILERQDLQFIWDTGRCLLVIGSLYTVNMLGLSADIAIFVYGMTMSFCYIILAFISARIIIMRRTKG